MPNPIRRILDQCKVGFTLGQKTGLTLGGVGYFIWPIDLLPDIVPPVTYLDDGLVIWLVIKILCAPTIRPTRPGTGAGMPMTPSVSLAIAADTESVRDTCHVISDGEA